MGYYKLLNIIWLVGSLCRLIPVSFVHVPIVSNLIRKVKF